MKPRRWPVKRPRFRFRHDPGTPPGTIESHPGARPSTVHVMAFGPEDLEEADAFRPDQVQELRSRMTTTWVNVDGLGSVDLLEEVARTFGIHPLALEDVVHVGQRPKVEEYDDQFFMVLRMTRGKDRPDTEQMSLFFGKGFVVTFQEDPGDSLEPVRRRIRQGRAKIRGLGPDYVAYCLIDAVVDGFFPVLEGYADRLLDMEEKLLMGSREVTIVDLYDIKRDIMTLRSAIRPMREAVTALQRAESELLTDATQLHLRDAFDHVLRIVDLVEHDQELAASLIELYRSNVQDRLNEVMKVLTIIATVFIPTTFIAGLYGMNFDPEASPWNLPELGWYWGYPFALTLMLIVALVMVFYFWRKGWIGSRSEKRPPEGPTP